MSQVMQMPATPLDAAVFESGQIENRPLVRQEGPPEVEMLRMAVEKGFDADQLAKLVALAEQMQAKRAEQAYMEAMAACQAELPTVVKDAENKFTKSWYARLETIGNTIKPIITKHGFFLSFTEVECPKPDLIRTQATCGHRAGHSTKHFMDLPADGGGKDGNTNKTPVQARGSTNTYANRYLTCDIFNIKIADRDNDGAGAMDTLNPDELAEVMALVKIKAVNEVGFLKWADVPSFDKILRSNLAKVKDMMMRKPTVAHAHVKKEASDDCKLCGKDLRDPIHNFVEE